MESFTLLAPQYRAYVDQCRLINGGPSYYRAQKKPGYHAHHITPISEGGTDAGSNCVWLTPKQHLRAHELLAMARGGMMIHIFISMCKHKLYQADERQILLARTLRSKLYSDKEFINKFNGLRKNVNNVKRRSSTGFHGVYDHHSSKKNPYVSYINIKGDRIRLGAFKTAELAAKVYDMALIQLGRNDSRNFPDLSLSDLRRYVMPCRVPESKPKPVRRGRRWTDEQKAAQAERMRNRVITDETRAKMGIAKKGNNFRSIKKSFDHF
ncbi:hypothetical protein K4M64_004527 [Salmonella enterica]|nr:hypothetical protein [Salmonella enterica]